MLVQNLAKVETRKQERAAGATADIQGKIVEHSFWLLKNGYHESTIRLRTRVLKLLMKRGANLLDPESVKEVIAKYACSENYKVLLTIAYHTFLASNGLTWTPPHYEQCQKLPFIPTEREIDDLIAGCRQKMAALLRTLKETGMRIGEAWRLTWADVDTVNNTIKVNDPEKNSRCRIRKVSSELIAMINALPRKSDRVFGTTHLNNMRRRYIYMRKRIAAKLKNPRIAQISFHTFRHWKATMEYHRTKDILHVMQLLGHKDIKSTLIYTQLVNFQSDEFHVKVAKTVQEATELLEAGFDYVTDMNGLKLFRKRK
jgi:integrase